MVDLPGSPDDRATEAPAGTAGGLDEIAKARDDDAEARDRRAENRDEDANARDAAADARDRAAETGDDVTTFDRSVGEPVTGAGPRPAAQPTDRAAVLAPAVSDRTMAAWDRTEGVSDRAEAAGDRYFASADRGASAGDRAAASLDELTGAHRRGAGLMELEREMARARRTRQHLVLAFVDVDRLKAINDSRGHAAGDRVLCEVVATCRAKLRSYDLIIRFGGDEFLCAIPGVSMDEAAQRLAAVNTTLAEFPEHGSVTTGLADLQVDDSSEDLIARADAALYQQRQQHAVIDLTSPRSGPVDPAVRYKTGRER
jgi:diguanylate cyclase (GGDEF)-like protein